MPLSQRYPGDELPSPEVWPTDVPSHLRRLAVNVAVGASLLVCIPILLAFATVLYFHFVYRFDVALPW